MRTKKTNKTPFIIFFALPLAALLVTGYVFLSKVQNWWPYNTVKSLPETSINTDANASDPSYTNNKTDDNKGSSIDKPTDKSSEKNTVQVGIGYAGSNGSSLEIEAFIPDIIEGTGTCTATLTKDGTTVSESSKAFIDATTSQCRQILIGLSRLSAGKWSLVVSYNSPTSQGSSTAMEVSI